ncbi:aminoglycoside phosphotransferase family protein [Castellaniella sp.]|uniref:aminoglycoside phosphotransferase family protein n=1 Tax=Castellaniella sp. TaxID=1955812 RepID=UPI002AFFBF93|nr:phosphotransferase [Castellaniella sp.]
MTSPNASDPRLMALHLWLDQQDSALGLQADSLVPVSGDASFRRYFRLQAAKGPLIVMDAPPPHEDCTSFVEAAARLAAGGLRVPDILAQDQTHGFLLLTDMGRQTFFQAIQAGATQDDATWQQHMRGALRALVRLQHCDTDGLPTYDASRLLQELSLFPQWYLQAHLGVTPDADTQAMLTRTFALLVGQTATQPQVFVHRDYHSPNLMIGMGAPDFVPGIIDFQDAVLGPISYDLASLVMDARTTWDESQQLDWAIRYWEHARTAGLPVPADFTEFHTQYEWMGLQRNLRILGIFARLALRDAKPQYLDHIPRVRAYVNQVASRYQVFHPLLRMLEHAENAPTRDGYSF